MRGVFETDVNRALLAENYLSKNLHPHIRTMEDTQMIPGNFPSSLRVGTFLAAHWHCVNNSRRRPFRIAMQWFVALMVGAVYSSSNTFLLPVSIARCLCSSLFFLHVVCVPPCLYGTLFVFTV